MPSDPVFSDARLAAVYDPLEPDRSDLDAYLAMAEEFGARRVLDVGCGTGTFACQLVERGFEVVGVDPAGASLDVARTKPGADRVQWIHGDATTLPDGVEADLATMTANVAQAFTTDETWEATLRAIHAALRPAGRLVFETRNPDLRAWEAWTPENTFVAVDIPGVGQVESWHDVYEVRGDLVTFRSPTRFVDDDVTIASESTLRFWSRADLTESLARCGYVIRDVRDAPDRPGREWVFVAERS